METKGFAEMLADLDGGAFVGRIEAAMKKVVIGVVANDRKGKVTVTFDFERIGQSSQVAVSHTVAFKAPTDRGAMSEEHTTETPLFSDAKGNTSVLPFDQGDFFRSKSEG